MMNEIPVAVPGARISVFLKPRERLENPPVFANAAVHTANGPPITRTLHHKSPLIHHEKKRATNIIPDELFKQL